MSMPSKPLAEALNAQVGHEFAAHQQYVACAVYYDAETLPRLAAFFYQQALEERGHAMMLVRYLLDRGVGPEIPAVPAPQSAFGDIEVSVCDIGSGWYSPLVNLHADQFLGNVSASARRSHGLAAVAC